jgi:hypothetical protein
MTFEILKCFMLGRSQRMWPTIQKQGNVYRRRHYAMNPIAQNPVSKKEKEIIRKKLVQNGRRYSENVQATKL